MRIAIIGTGVAGLVTAHLLQDRHDITVFEARDRIGGHVNTIAIEERSGRLRAVDTGFIVYNETNYPLFTKLMSDLGVATQPSNMSFGVRSDAARLEYSSASLTTLFAQRRNLFSPGYIRMLRDILRFNRDAAPAILNGAAALTLGEYIETTDLSPRLAEHYLMPMGSALWSIPGGRVLEMPAEFFVRFFENHGMLTVNNQPEWRVIEGGSARYVEALATPFRDRVRTSTPAIRTRLSRSWLIRTAPSAKSWLRSHSRRTTWCSILTLRCCHGASARGHLGTTRSEQTLRRPQRSPIT